MNSNEPGELTSGMSNQDDPSAEEPVYRCPRCDSVVTAAAERCLMCGAEQPERPLAIPHPPAEPEPEPEPIPDEEPEPILAESTEPEEPVQEDVETEPESSEEVVPEPEPEHASLPVFVHVEDPEYAPKPLGAEAMPLGLSQSSPKKPPRQINKSAWLYGGTAVVIIIVILIGIVTTEPPQADAIVQQTVAVLLTPSSTFTPQPSPVPTDTETPLPTATNTLTPPPTDTLEPPRQHTISSGDTLFDLALQYRISLDSILEANDMTQNSAIIAGQPLLIPWPTPTPPLEPVGMEFNGELVIADPHDCRRYDIVAGDSLNAIAARADIDYDLFLLVNRLTSDSIIQPGDTICLPEIVYGATLPPTAGPSPTPSTTPPPLGPSLLYPVQEAVIEPPTGLITLQWVALKDLAEDEWYMVELTDMDRLDAAPWRGFTRDNAFQVPSSWRPPVAAPHQMRWRVSLVQVTGFREDGLPLFTYGGQSSDDAFFIWEGAVPTPTPAPTATPTATAIPVPATETP